MIKGITGGNGLIVGGGSTSYPYIPMNSNNPIQGMIRLNGQDFQVFDGSAWQTLALPYANVELNGDSQSLLQWARTERDRQMKREALLKDNPALQKAMDAIKRAEDNFDILSKFVEHDQSETTTSA